MRPMKGQPKRPKHVAPRTRRIVAANIKTRMDARYAQVGDKRKALAEDAGTSLSTVQRALDPDLYATGITIDTLTQIANALHCEPRDLLS